MSLSLGELLLQLRIDPTAYYQQLEKARLAAVRSGTEIERSLNLNAKVDDRSLSDLNKHLDLKQRHWTQTNQLFQSKPLTPKVDDRALTALNQTLDQLSGKSVGVSVTTSGNSPNATPEKIKPQIDASGIEGSVAGAIESGFKKVKPSSGSAIGGIVTAPFKLVKGMLGTVFEGAGLQIGGSIAKDLGDGLSDGIQAELSHLIGSFRLVGKTLGQGLSEELINSMGRDLEGIEDSLNEIFGKTNIEVEGFVTRGQQTAKEDKRRGFAGQQARVEDKAFKQNHDRLKQTQEDLLKQQAAFQESRKAYEEKFEGEVDRLGGGSRKEQMEEKQQQREALYGQIKQATDSGDTQAANALQGQMKTLADSYSDLARQLREIYQLAESNLSEDSAALEQQAEKFYARNRQFQKEVVVGRHQDLLRIPANVAAKSGRVVQDAGVRGTQQHQTVSGFYEQVVAEVAKRSNLAMPSQEMIPRLVANDKLPKNAQASYRAGLNEIHVRPETIEGIAKGDLGDDEFETLIHELRHAMQAMFGELAGTSEVAVDLLKATSEEAREVGRRIEASVGANTGGSASYNRAIEEDAYIFARRNKSSIGQAVSGKQAQARFVDSVGIGGGGLENQYNENRLELLKTMSKQAQKASQKVDVTDENKAMFAGLSAIDETFKQSLADIPNIADLSPAEIDAELARLEDSYKAAMAELKSLTTDFIQAVMKKPEEVVAVARETMGTFNRKQDLIPIAQKVGIADADKLSKPQLIEAIAASPDTRSMTDEVFGVSRARAAKIQARRDAIEDAKARAAEAAYGAGVAARKVVGAGQAVMQSPAGQGARRAIGAAGQVARLGYGIAQGVENVALDFVPGGRMMKGVGQQFVLPAAMFSAATHMIPGGQAMAHGLQGMAQGALSPMANNAAHMFGGEAGQAVANMLPNILGLKAQVMTAVSSGVEQLMTGAATAAIDAAVAIGGGKVIQNVVSKPVQAIAGKPQAALPPARQPFQIAAAQKQREKVAELVEAVPKQLEATATIGQTTRNPSPFGIKPPAQKAEAVASSAEFKFELMPTADVLAMVEERKNKIEQQFKQINAQFKASIGDGKSVNNAQIATFSSTFRNIIDQGRKDLDQLLETVRDSGASSPELIAKIGGLKGRLTQKEQGMDKKLRRLKSQQPSGSIDVEASPVEERYAVSGKAAQVEIDRVMRSFGAKLKQNLPDIAAIAGGTVAGVAAGGSGHVAGAAAGVMGSMAGRGAAIAGQSANDAYTKLRDSEQFKAGTLLQKFNAILTETTTSMRAMEASMGDGLTGDMTGAAIAAAIDQILDAVSPSLAAIPGKGAAAATVLTPVAVEARKRFAGGDQAAYAFEDLSKQIDAVLADFGGLGEESDQVAYAFRDLAAIVEEMQARFGKVNPNAEVEAAQAEAGGHRAAFKFERAEQNINRRYDQSLKMPDGEGPETLTSRMKRVIAASGSMDGIRGKIGGVIGTVAKLPGVMSLALTSFLGFNAIAVLGPLFASITNGASEAALEMERFTRVINFTSGGSAKGAENLASLRSEANRLGLDLKSSIAGYAQFSASTKDTGMESQTMSVFSNVSQASANYGLRPQAQERVFTALSQMASKGVVSMEELRQQLGESLPGALNTAARSMGMTTKEFSKMVERGEVLSSDFLPKFAMQLGAESSTGVNGAAKSAQASFNRLNNTIFELQVTIGKGLLGAQKIGADVAVVGIQKLTGVLELLLKILPTVGLMFGGKFVAGLTAGKAIIPLLLSGLAKIGPALLKLLPTIAVFLAKFILIQAAVESLKAIGDVLTDNGGKFGEFADSARKGLDDYKAALAEANQSQVEFTKNLPTNIKDVKGESTLGGTIVGSAAKLIFGEDGKKFVDGAESNILRGLGMTTRAEHNAANRDIRMSDIIKSGAEARLSVVQEIKGPNSNLNQMRDIDTQLESVQGRRRALAVTSPNDKDGLRDLKKQEDDLLAQRERLGKPVATLQQANAADIEMYKASIKELNQLAQDGKITQGDYEKNIYAMNSALEIAQKSQDELNKAIKTSVNSLESFERAWASIINRLEDANFALKRTGDESRKAIALAELGGGTQGSSNRSSEILQQEQLRLKIEATRAAIAQMRAELDVQDVATVQTNFNINDQTGPNEIKALADRATGPKEKAILERLSQLKTMEGEVIGFDADLAEAQVAAKRRLIDLTKQVQEFYRGIERQAQESALDAKNISREITGNNAKAKLKGALKGFQDNYVSEFVDSLVGLIDSLNEPFKIAIEANKQILGKQNQLADVMRQSQEMMNQLPNGSEGMGMTAQQGQMVAAGNGAYGAAVNSIADNTIRVVRTGKKDDAGAEELQIQLIKGGKVVATEKAASGVASNQKFEIAGKNTQGAGSLAPIPEGMYNLGAVERGNFGGGLGQTWIDILDPKTNSSAISGTGRSAFGLHEDANRFTGSPGSAGCVVFYDAAATNRVADWVKGGARKMQVDWGLGTFSSGIKPPPAGNQIANQVLPSPRGGNGSLESRIAAGLQIAIPDVKRSESFRSRPYDDGVGVMTIGYGETDRSVVGRGSITEPEAASLMARRIEQDYLRPALAMIPKAVREKLTPGQIAAIGSFAYNTGVGEKGFPKSSFGKALIAGDVQRAERELPESYINRGSDVEQGLRNRRQGELKMWRSSAPSPGVMMPTTGMNQGQVQQYEFQAKEFDGLRGQVDRATALAQGTANAEIEQIKKLAESQITLKQAENLQAIRKAKRQLIVGGRDQERGNRALPEQLEDIEKSLGDDTALKSLRNDISGKKREARDYKERLADSIEKTQSSLVDAESMIELIQSGGMPEQFNQFLPELKKQRDSITKQLTSLRATDAKVDKTFGKAIADIQRKYNLDLLGRQFESGQRLSGEQIKSARAEAETIRAEIEQPFTTPEAKKVGQFRSAKLDRYAGLSEVRNEEASRKEELRKLAIAQPDIYNPERIAAETKFLEEASKRKMATIESQYQKAIKDIDHDLVTKELERSREGIKRSIEQLREQARDLQVQGKDEKLLASDPIRALGLQQQSYEKSYEADLQAMQVEVEEFNQQQDELVRSSQRTRDAAEQAKKQFLELNQVKLGNLKSELAQNTAELERQRQEIQYQSKARLFDIDQQFGAEQIKKFREFDGNGIGAIDLQQKLDLGKLEFDLTAKLRDLDLDKTITPEAKAQIRDRLRSIAEMQANSITINADLAREDNEFQSKTLLFNAAMQANSAKGNYARTLGFESQARDADKAGAIAQEQYNLADGLRKIDEQARSLGLAPEVVEQLKGQLESLNQVNLKNINAQFNPLVDAMKSVKGAFQGFMGDIISGNETIGDAFNKMVDNILQSLSALAAQLITEQLFGSLFGLGKGGGGGEKGGKGGGGIGGIFASIFGFADGAVVPSIGQGDLRKRPDAIGQALRKEGPNSVLAALTPGERVLSPIETQRFYGLGLNRWVERPSTTLARVASSERAQKVYNFAMGGVVPGAAPIAPGAAGNMGTNNISIPIAINGGGGQNPGINVPRLRDAIRAEILEEFRRQRRPRSEFG